MLEGSALLLLAIAALLFQRSATVSWAETRASSGQHLQVSPIGVADWGLGTSGTPPAECRWWPKIGKEELCAVTPGGERAMSSLRRSYPLVVIGLYAAVLAIFLSALRIPHVPRAAGIVVAAALPLLALLAMRAVFMDATRALAVMSGLTLQPVATGLGTVVAAAFCGTLAAVLLVLSGRARRT